MFVADADDDDDAGYRRTLGLNTNPHLVVTAAPKDVSATAKVFPHSVLLWEVRNCPPPSLRRPLSLSFAISLMLSSTLGLFRSLALACARCSVKAVATHFSAKISQDRWQTRGLVCQAHRLLYHSTLREATGYEPFGSCLAR